MELRTLNPRALNEQTFVSVAIDRSKGSQHAFRWAADNLLMKGQTVTCIHVNQISSPSDTPLSSGSNSSDGLEPNDQLFQDIFLPFRVYAQCKEVTCDPVTIDDNDIAKALIEYVSLYRIETLVIGASSKNGIARTKLGRLFNKTHDIPSTILKTAPDFCNVYIISKGKINATRPATRPLRTVSPLGRFPPQNSNTDENNFMSPQYRTNNFPKIMPDEIVVGENDFSFTSSSRQSTDSMFNSLYDQFGSEKQQLLRQNSMFKTNIDTQNLDKFLQRSASKLTDHHLSPRYNASEILQPETNMTTSDKIDDMEEKMRRLELQMNQTMEMYHAACKEALKDKQKAKELHIQRKEEERKLAQAIREKEEALAVAHKEREICSIAIEAAKTAQKKAEKEIQKRKVVEMKLLKEAENTKIMLNSLDNSKIAAKYQSLLRIFVVFVIFYFYFFELR